MSRSRSRSRSRTRSRSPQRARSMSIDRSPSSKRKTQSDAAVSSDSIRVFVTKGKHTHISDFDKGDFPLRDEFLAYGSKNTTPSQIIALLYPSFPPVYRHPAARYSFKHIYVDATPRGLYRSTDLVSFTARDLLQSVEGAEVEHRALDKMDMELDDTPDEQTGKKGRKIEEKTLDEYGYVIGDLLSVSVWTPEPKIRPPGSFGAGERPSNGESSFGWGDKKEVRGRDAPRGGFGRDPAPSGGWGRGGPLPPQNFRGNHRDEIGGGSWRGGHSSGQRGNGGGRNRSSSPGPRERGRRDDGGRGGDDDTGGWDRSPPRNRRDSWSRR